MTCPRLVLSWGGVCASALVLTLSSSAGASSGASAPEATGEPKRPRAGFLLRGDLGFALPYLDHRFSGTPGCTEGTPCSGESFEFQARGAVPGVSIAVNPGWRFPGGLRLGLEARASFAFGSPSQDLPFVGVSDPMFSSLRLTVTKALLEIPSLEVEGGAGVSRFDWGGMSFEPIGSSEVLYGFNGAAGPTVHAGVHYRFGRPERLIALSGFLEAAYYWEGADDARTQTFALTPRIALSVGL